MADETGLSIANHRHRERQSVSVPFLWEDRPGRPKKDWKLKPSPVFSVRVPVSPAASIPFGWEQKPGTPLPEFLKPQTDCPILPLPPPAGLIHIPSLEKSEEMFDLDVEAFVFDTKNISTNGSAENWDSSTTEEEDSSSSGSMASADASVLQFLFPLFSPEAGFLEKKFNEDGKQAQPVLQEPPTKDDCRVRRNVLARRTLTLGELILMSRKLSCARRTAEQPQAKKPAFLTEFVKKSAIACIMCGTSSDY
ncbi:hypothetical protein QJS10_CPB11g00505 [Acorus calamus]|uniref:Hydroxyproline-rich glycoprotein family protein n=1 Tax=Acorus calamus TaxID=4465 RepID=A0AAV9DQJ3_ACOCL|nr:hypothetical protein QJS10_CPB11g00505 [Acorus calamus]